MSDTFKPGPEPLDVRQLLLFAYHGFMGVAVFIYGLLPISGDFVPDFETFRALASILGLLYLLVTAVCMAITRYLVSDVRNRNLIAMWGPPLPFLIAMIWLAVS